MVGRIKKKPCVEQETDTVYIYQTPKSEWIPSVSPDCLKFETLLRMMDIPHKYVDNETMTVSPISQLPQIKVNGKEMSYTSKLPSELAETFGKGKLSLDEANGYQRAFEGMIEGRLRWVLIYIRATQANQLPSHDVFQGRFGQIFAPITKMVVTSKLKTKADYQGIGRQNASVVLATGKDDLRAISAYLGEKDYLAGEQPNELDATAFAHLCQFLYVPIDHELKTFIKEECKNLEAYVERMKTRYWADWEDKCRKPPPPKPEKVRKTKKEEVAVVVEQQENGNENKEEAVNGCPEKVTSTIEEKQPSMVNKEVKIESTVEIVSTNKNHEDEKKVEKIVAALENGLAEEIKHVSTPNGGAATIEKVAE